MPDQPAHEPAHETGDEFVRVQPVAWRARTRGEPRWVPSLAVAAAIGLQWALPTRLAIRPWWVLPAVGSVLLAALWIADPRHIDRRAAHLRVMSIALTVVLSGGNAVSAVRLVLGVLHGTLRVDAPSLLLSGGAIWLTNVVVFAFWYWELDRGGPADRAHGIKHHPDLLFPQMTSPELAPASWEPLFVDYLYVSFTNAAAFSPTDVLPLARWAKLTMLLQSLVSLSTLALVIARAINILPQH